MDKLILQGVTKRYGEATVVNDLNLSLRQGEFVSLLGPSGCGKTTTLRMIAGFVAPSAGEIVLDGRCLSSPRGSLPPEKRGMSMIFQSYALWPNMTVEQNVAFGLKMRRVPKAEARRRVGEILEVVHLGHLARRLPNELSGGQQQRVSLARALVVKPEVLLLDEPLSNLDANLREEMRSEIRRLHDEFRITSIYVTHDQAEAMTTSDRIAVMNQGRIEQIDDPLTLYTRPQTRYVAEFIGRSNILQGRVAAERVHFPGFEVPHSALAAVPAADGAIAFSLRAQSVVLHQAQPAASDAVLLPGTVTERAFLGETWDYTFRADHGELRLRVMAPPRAAYQVGQSAWLEIDPAHIVPVRDSRAEAGQ